MGTLVSPFEAAARDEDSADAEVSDDDLRLRGLFERNLPNTEREHSLKFILHPHFGDLHRYDYLRVPMGVRYGLSDRWEASAELETFLPHGLGGGAESNDWGVSGYRLSSKLNYDFFPDFRWDQVLGVEYTSPFSNPPAQIIDGYTHFKPYMNFARYTDYGKSSRWFWGVGLDLVGKTKFEGTDKENAIGENANTFTFGRVWEREDITYTLETVFATSRFLGETDRDLYVIRPGIVWKVPTKYTFNSRGNWVLGCGFKLSNGEDGFDYGLSLKVKMNFKFKD